jgi:hypothetical protein
MISYNFKQTLMKPIQNNQKYTGKPFRPMDFKNLKKKSLETFAKCLWFPIWDFGKENHNLEYGF